MFRGHRLQLQVEPYTNYRRMQAAESPNGQLTPPGGLEETPISSSSATYPSAMTLDRPRTRGIKARLHPSGLSKIKVGGGIFRDIRARAPWYWSDWKDAWNYRVLPATTLVFFAK